MPKKCLDAALTVAYDHDIWYTCVKLYLQVFFFAFSKFWFFRGKRAKHSVHRVPHLKNHVPYDCHLWYTFVKCWYLQVFSSFWFSWLLGGKSAKNGKKKWQKILSVALHSVRCTPYLRSRPSWLSFMVHMYKMIISPGNFLIFSKVRFSGLCGGGERGVKRAKNCPIWQKILSVVPYI